MAHRAVQELVQEIKMMTTEERLLLAETVVEAFSLPESILADANPTDESWRFKRLEGGFRVDLIAIGSDEKKVIKLLHQDFSFSPRQARDFLKELPKPVLEKTFHLKEAEMVKRRYEEAGAIVSIEREDFWIYDPAHCPPGCAFD